MYIIEIGHIAQENKAENAVLKFPQYLQSYDYDPLNNGGHHCLIGHKHRYNITHPTISDPISVVLLYVSRSNEQWSNIY